MVCVVKCEAICVVRDMSASGPPRSAFVTHVPGSTPVRELVDQVAKEFGYEANTVELVYSSNTVAHIVLNGSSEETLLGSGIKVDGESRNNFILQLKSTSNRASLKAKEMNGECELAMGASASPTGGATPKYHGPRVDQPPASQLLTGHEYTAALIKQDTGYVGLVNQAMTCYLNSLLQALYMTPEFRNALYNWKYDPNTFKNKAYKCIPYQLQKLFLNLQTSQKTAVETTDLTKSFGWESSDAWQQHDIQELCRVMFDALEQVFKNTTQSDLIDRLYQGKMMDYVKCLECGKEKSREDTFLDIPLPVRPFGSTVAYGSVEEALRAFVQPETLDGANQYLCESCAKKCDAHKGLKFTKFPYLLTLHLKRFDFDYSTLHRIKLNDKVTFPMTLDLNSFVEQKKEKEEGSEEELAVSKNDNKDDSSTTDSGSALDDEGCHCQPVSEAATAGDSSQEDDEGIDVSSSNGTNHHENEKNRRHGLPKGPYLYDLFSIMIHSGSASGGHYYAYIKDFSNGEWFCFNDTSVTRITNDDIAKTYGGGSLRSYYSGAYSTSTNAYMLMYRQISEDNCGAMKVDELPEHIKELYKTLQENEQRTKEKANDIVKIKVYCQHPIKGVVDSKIYVYEDSTLQDATSQAYEAFKLSDAVPLSNCRLVSYNHAQESIEVSFDNRETEMFYDILTGLKHEDMLLEIKCTDEEFEEYKPGGLTLKVYVVDLDKEEVAAPVSLRVMLSSSIEELKKSISTISGITSQPENIVLVMHRHGLANDLIVLEDDLILLQNAGLYSSNKIYVSSGPVEKNFLGSKLHTVIDRFEHVLILHLALPDTDPDTLARLSIPSLSASQAITAKQSGDSPLTPTALDKVSADQALVGKVGGTGRSLTLPLILTGGGDEDGGGAGGGSGGAGGHSDQSASEDSSLTDSDRTLIGDVPDECLSDGDNQLASPPEDEPFSIPSTESPPVADEAYDEHWDDPSSQTQPKLYNYFKVCHTQKLKKMLKVQVDKRMLVETLKTCLEPYVGVPASCLKLVRVGDSESMRSRTCDSLASLKTEDALIVQLDRQLTADEHRVKVHLLQVNAAQPVKFLCDWIIGKGGLVGQTKKEIIDEMNKRNEMSLEYDKCRLRKKSWKNIGKVYLDNQTWVDDIMMYNNSDVFLQELDEPEQVMSSSQLCLLTRHWHPSTLALNPFCELVLDESTVADLKEKLSIKSNIPVEYVEFAKPSSLFPCDMSILSIHSELEWNHKNITTLDAWPLQINEDGAVIFYRDSREKLKQLSTDERSELTNKEAARLNTTGTVSTYSPRKERPLRIHLDLDRKSISQSDSTDAN